jgi:hypothetical protein
VKWFYLEILEGVGFGFENVPVCHGFKDRIDQILSTTCRN